MSEIIFTNVSKVYRNGDSTEKYALKNVNLSFNSGLICIIGKSGSGKSTLLNMVGLMDFPTSGNVIIDGKDINKLRKSDKCSYRRNKCSYIFQHYHLLEEHSALFNVALPSLISGSTYRKTKKKAFDLLSKFGFDEEKANKKVKYLSGGEKERVAILRAVINDPSILLADEPTGALDIKNSQETMHILKEISKNRLVIMVTHNEELVKEYADRVIRISDGSIVEDITIYNTPKSINKGTKAGLRNDEWTSKIVAENLKKRSLRNLVTTFSLVISIISTLLIIGFSTGSKESIDIECRKKLDLGVGTFSKETNSKIGGSALSLVKTTRPSLSDLNELKRNNEDFVFSYNYDALLSGYQFYIGEQDFNEILYSPVYSFEKNYINKELLYKGRLPRNTLDECLINDKCFNYLKDKIGFEPLDYFLQIKVTNEFNYYTGDILKPYITDYFVYEKTIKVVGAVKELNFLSSPKVYFPYAKFEEYAENTLLNNLSDYYEYDINWYQRIVDVPDGDILSSYSFYAFLKNYKDIDSINRIVINNEIKYTNNGLLIGQTLKDLINASSVGMELFLIIAILGCCLILGILSFSSYSEDRKKCAILECLGAEKSQIEEIYIIENILIALFSSIFSLIASIFLVKPLNNLLKIFLGFDSLINIPMSSFLGIRFLLPLFIVLGSLFVAAISTLIPIKFSKKISIKEELADE